MPVRNPIDRRFNSAEFRQPTHTPVPPIEQIENELQSMLSTLAFTPLRMVPKDPALRDRVLSLPVMTAVVLGLVLRNIPSQKEAVRMLGEDGLLWAEPTKITRQALSDRFRSLPAGLFAQMLKQVVEHYRQQRCQQQESVRQILEPWQHRVASAFSAVWTVDASTLEALRRTTNWLRQTTDSPGERLGGKLHAIVETMTSTPVAMRHDSNAQADELTATDWLLEQLPQQGLAVLDEGYFQFELFDRFSDAEQYFLTRMRQQVSYRTLEVLSEGTFYRDEIIECGMYRSNPCRHRLRLVSVRWNGTWYRYVTNVLDPKRLSAEDVCRLYRRRWRIESAFKQVKQLLGLSHLWVGDLNGVQMQINATWIIYTVLMNLCMEVAAGLGTTLDRISYEMVYRSLYYYSRARQRGEADDVVSYLVSRSKTLNIVKERRKRHREQDDHWAVIWGYA